MRFEFATATRILFGQGTHKEAAPIAASLGSRALIVFGSTSDQAAALADLLGRQNVSAVTFGVSGEPAIETVQTGMQIARESKCDVMASTGLDALTQLIEPFTCSSPNPLVDAISREGIQRAAQSLKRAYQDGENVEARQDMSLAALLGGMALANVQAQKASSMKGNPIVLTEEELQKILAQAA